MGGCPRGWPVSAGSEERIDKRSPIRRALVSVYDKTGLEELAPGCTRRRRDRLDRLDRGQVAAAGVAVTPVEELTGFPECLDGRVKTLHPKVHAGISPTREARARGTARRARGRAVRAGRGEPVSVRATVASGASPDECVEQIDIGGPSMVRAAAKNHGSVAVVVEPSRYADMFAALSEGGFSRAQRQQLAAAAFAHTAAYDVAVASWIAAGNAPDESHGTPASPRTRATCGARPRTPVRREPAPARGPL